MSKTKKTNKVRDLAIIETGNREYIKAEIKAFAFDQETQNLLIKKPEMRPILELYMSLRKLGPQPIAMLLSTKRGEYPLELIRSAITGHILNERNEELLEQNYPELLEEYLATKKAIEAEKEKEMSKYRKTSGQALAGLFTPEMLAKLAV